MKVSRWVIGSGERMFNCKCAYVNTGNLAVKDKQIKTKMHEKPEVNPPAPDALEQVRCAAERQAHAGGAGDISQGFDGGAARSRLRPIAVLTRRA